MKTDDSVGREFLVAGAVAPVDPISDPGTDAMVKTQAGIGWVLLSINGHLASIAKALEEIVARS